MASESIIYRIGRAEYPLYPTAEWDRPPWTKIEPITLEHHMGTLPAHRPLTQAKLLYDYNNVYVIFRVMDAHVAARARCYQDHVCNDSCVEFFFTPGTDPTEGYFNIETNCGGTMLFSHQYGRDDRCVPVDWTHARRMNVAHTMPPRVDPEVHEPAIWVVEYRVPIDILSYYAPTTRPSPGVRWRANFYKCADASEHPHWLTWSRVELPEPDFHQSGFFGTLEFA